MNLIEINPEKTPEKFYSRFDENQKIWIETEVLSIPGGIQLRKRCLDGWQDMLLRYGVLQLYFIPELESAFPDESNAVLVADGILIPQKKDGGDWVNLVFKQDDIFSSLLDPEQNPHDAYSLFDNGIDTVEIFFNWRIGNSKQTYVIGGPVGNTVRMSAIVNDYKIDGVDVKQNFSDFLGMTNVETLTEQSDLLSTKYIFESEGKTLTIEEPEFIVDPAMEIVETATSFKVFCDGYELQFSYGNTGTYNYIFMGADTIGYIVQTVRSSGVTYYLKNDTARTAILLEDGPYRKVIRIKGVCNATYGSTPCPNMEYIEVTYYIYPDRMVMKVVISASGGNIVIDTSSTFNAQTFHGYNPDLINEKNACANSGATAEEDPGLYPTITGREYYGFTADNINITISEIDVDTAYRADYDGPAKCWCGINTTTITDGSKTECTIIMVIDSVLREDITPTVAWVTSTTYDVEDLRVDNDVGFECIVGHTSGTFATDYANGYWRPCHKYTSAERLEMGHQYADTTIPDPTTGSWVTDLVEPANVGVDGFAVDSAIHVAVDGSEVEFDNDLIRHKQPIVIYDFPYYSGTVGSETDYLVGHWKCDDDATNTTIDATVGTDGTFTGGDNTEDVSSLVSIRGTSFLLNGTDDYINLSSAISDLTSTNIFSISVNIKPNSDWNTQSADNIIGIGSGTGNYIAIQNNGGIIRIESYINANVIRQNITPDFGLGSEWIEITLSVDLANNIIIGSYNGITGAVIIESNNWSSTPDKLYVGRDMWGNNGAYYIDEIKLFDGCILPYGAYFTGNGTLDTATCHSDILFYWNCESTTAKITSGLGSDKTADESTGSIQNIIALVGTNAYDNESGGNEVGFDVASTSFDFDSGSLSMWFNIQTWATNDALFGIGTDSNNYIRVVTATGGELAYTYMSNSQSETVVSTTLSLDTTDVWHHLRVTWDAGNLGILEMFVDGVSIGTDTHRNTWQGNTSERLYFCKDYTGSSSGIDAVIDQVFVTNNPNTPQIPTANGIPLHIPLIEVA